MPGCRWADELKSVAVNLLHQTHVFENEVGHVFHALIFCGSVFLSVAFGFFLGGKDAQIGVEVAFSPWLGEVLVGDGVEFRGARRHIQSPSEVEGKAINYLFAHLQYFTITAATAKRNRANDWTHRQFERSLKTFRFLVRVSTELAT